MDQGNQKGQGSGPAGSDTGARWRRINQEGAEWEARTVSGPAQTDPGHQGDEEEILEFVCLDQPRQTRRLAVRPGSLAQMSDEQLHRAFVQARPIGGDHYGRPGKRMDDIG